MTGQQSAALKEPNYLRSEGVSEYPKPKKTGEPWPQGVSRQPVYSIGKVVDKIKAEFPALTVSKVRYLEEQGILEPVRSDSGYRKYSEADIMRLRFCLSAQRDSFLPIKVIYDRLKLMDAGEEAQIPQSARLVASDGELVAGRGEDSKITLRELLDMTGTTRDDLDRLAKIGLIKPDLSGRFPGKAHQVVRLAAALEKAGIDLSQLRFLVTAAHRSVDVMDRSISQGINLKSPTGKERRHAQLEENAELAAQLFTQLIRISSKDIV